MNDVTDEERLDDMRRYAEDAIETLGNTSYADFLNDANLRHAIFYLVAIVGEAASRTTGPTRRLYPTSSWRTFRSLRNILIHEYHSVKPNRIYEAVTDDLPALLTALKTPVRQRQGGQPL
ncbi:MAG: DUF86 domain-containing protein [Chloroflexi bacterium]|nr:DUF86 domain-containing protein [Chloroflexota bacterium]